MLVTSVIVSLIQILAFLEAKFAVQRLFTKSSSIKKIMQPSLSEM